MRLFLGLICLIICSFFGYILSQKYTLKKNFYLDFKNFNERFISEVSFTQKTLPQLIKDNDSDFYSLLRFKLFNNELLKLKYLKKEEYELLNDYISNIGKSDKHTQMLYLNSIKTQIDNNFSKSKDDEKKYKTLYIKMGFLLGLIILVVLL